MTIREIKSLTKFIFVLIISSSIFIGCTLKVQRGIPVDQTKKTMTVPATGRRLFEIKQELRKAGWKLKIADTSLEEEQTSKKKKVTQLKFDTAYRLYYSYASDGFSQLTVVENKSDEMVLEIESSDHEGERLGRELVKALGNQDVQGKKDKDATPWYLDFGVNKN